MACLAAPPVAFAASLAVLPPATIPRALMSLSWLLTSPLTPSASSRMTGALLTSARIFAALVFRPFMEAAYWAWTAWRAVPAPLARA